MSSALAVGERLLAIADRLRDKTEQIRETWLARFPGSDAKLRELLRWQDAEELLEPHIVESLEDARGASAEKARRRWVSWATAYESRLETIEQVLGELTS